MRSTRILAAFAVSCIAAVVARAVYAPIPEQDQGREFSTSVRAGVSYDNNIFGAATHAISSVVYEVSPEVRFNASLSPTTFFSASYRLSLDYFESRPGQKLLDGHTLDARLDHAFSRTSTLDLNEAFLVTRNPESALAGVPVNTDQSYLSNQVDGRLTFAPTQRLGMVLKARSLYYDYFNSFLGTELNRFENLFGAEANHAFLPDLKGAAEYRHEDVDYTHNGATNDKHSEFLMVGPDYRVGPKISVSARLGVEWRRLSGYGEQTAPHAEFSAKYDYARLSFVSLGYVYDLAETSDPIHFFDERTNRLFLNVQHALTAGFVASASIDYEPSRLVGRAGQANINETSSHLGGALSYLPSKRWTVSATYDYDLVDSGQFDRGMNRSRVGVNGSYAF